MKPVHILVRHSLSLAFAVFCLSGCAAPTLQEAAKAGQSERIIELLNRGDDINSHDGKQGKTALHWAAQQGDLKVAMTLVEHGADVNAKDEDKWTPIDWCVYRAQAFKYPEKHLEVMQYLLEKGADANAADKDGWTALHYAGYYNKSKAAEILLAHGVDVNARTNAEQTPLSVATAYGASDVAALV